MAVYDLPAFEPTPSLLSGLKNIPRNPTLPQTPLGAYTDAQFEAQDAALRAQYLRRYNDLVRQIGYVDPNTGQVIKGDIESTADATRAQAQRDMFLAGVDTINQAQNEGNYFSGYQVVRKARAEYPYANEIAGLDVSVPKAIGQAQEDAASALQDYVIGRNQLLADAAARAADAARNNPSGSGGHGDGGLPPGSKPIGGAGWGPHPGDPNPNVGGLGDNPPNPIQVGPDNFPGAPAPPPLGSGNQHGLGLDLPPLPPPGAGEYFRGTRAKGGVY